MRKLHRFAHTQKQRDPLWKGQMVLVAEAMDGHAIHILHHQVGVAIRSNAAIKKTGYEGMVEAGKNLPFLAKSLPKQIGRQGQIDKLDGYVLLELAIRAMRQIYRAHTSASEKPVQQIGA